MSCRLVLVRHGETTWNKEMRFQGHTDVPLSPQGEEQARSLGQRLARSRFDAVYASDLGRARLTADILARPHRLPVQVLPGLREINFGKWEGLTLQEINEQYQGDLMAWWSSPLTARVPGGETLAEMVERTMWAVQEIFTRHQDGQVLVVAHGGAIRSIIGTVLGLDLNQYWRLRQDNTALNIIDLPEWGKGILVLFNDCSHLGPARGVDKGSQPGINPLHLPQKK
ncbi:MAG: alpha-ribazole phosphatase [Bacillota bacterium]|jgi:alpha-ribazole phosphatase/probable phosphoglycerate mutase